MLLKDAPILELETFNEDLRAKSRERSCCAEELVIIRDYLVGQLEDEVKASREYREISKKMVPIGPSFNKLHERFEKMAEDEFQHYLNLIAATSILNQLCSCEEAV